MLAASAAFRAAGDPRIAADVVGSMLTRWHYIALVSPLVLFILGRNLRRIVQVALFAAIVFAAAQVFVDLRIRAIRAAAPIPVSDLDPADPVRRRFGALHGASMLLLALQALTAAAVVMSRTEKKEESRMAVEDREDDAIVVNKMDTSGGGP